MPQLTCMVDSMTLPRQAAFGATQLENTALDSVGAENPSSPDAEFSSDSPSATTSSDHELQLPKRLGRWLRGGVLLSLIGMPIFFGSVHSPVALSFYSLFYAALAALLVFGSGYFAHHFNAPSNRSFRLIANCLSVAVAVATLPLAARSFFQVSHPVLGTVSSLANWSRSIESVLSIVFFLAAFTLIRTLLSDSQRFQSLLLKAGALSAFVVCLIALSHWLYDNGKLFWNFAPDHVFISNRARWPFVNANHLGHYLLLAAIFVGLRINYQRERLQHVAAGRGITGHSFITAFSVSKSYQRAFGRLLVMFVVAVTVILTLIVTLSRSSWAAFAVWIAICTLCWRNSSVRPPSPPVLPHSSRRKRRERSSSRGSWWVRFQQSVLSSPWAGRAIPLASAAVLLVLLLNDIGQERLVQRLDYGLATSKDDMRFQFYRDSWALFKEAPWWGIGLGSWNDLYTRVMHPSLAGLNPDYLHSDPLQLLFEAGVIGIMPFLVMVAVLITNIVSLARRNITGSKLLIFLASGLLCFLFASFFDFPFRVPAILLQLAALLALTSFYVDEERSPRHRRCE